jgi:lipopolysaccharide assembly outer membrane protein LptD (OstA)
VGVYYRHHGLLLLLVAFPLSPSVFGQAASPPQPDTTLAGKPLRKKTLEGPVRYEARRIRHLVDEKKTVLTGSARVAYQAMVLTASRITIDWDKRFLLAEGLPDSVWVKTADGDSARAWRLAGLPEFTESGDVMKGEVMTYDFETRRGRVLRGRTAYEDGFYSGSTLKMMSSKVMNVADGRFTTCDLDSNPHFHFWSSRMKLLVNDKVVARPIVLYAGRIPVAALPFLLFPAKKGRHSGILIPRYGESTLQGRYLRGLGYYWAPNDYFDVRPSLDYFERSGFLFGMNANYAVRYKVRGSVSGSLTRKTFEALGRKERRWDLNVQHGQELSPTARIDVSGYLVSSGDFYREVSTSREFRLQREIRSNATLTKRFGPSWSMSLNCNQTRNLGTGDITESLPQLSLRSGQSLLFPKSKSKSGRADTRWYRQIYWRYSSQLLSRRSVSHDAGAEVTQRAKGWDHSVSLSGAQKWLGWLNVNPSVNYSETWFDRIKEYDLNDSSNAVESRIRNGFFARRRFDLSATFGTKVYGTFFPRFLKSTALRHVATPSLSLTYQPDFSNSRFGYYQAVTDTAGKSTLYDRYGGGLFGGTPRTGSRRLSFGVQNLFQAKIGDGEKAKKIDLFNYSLSSSYDWNRTEYKLGDLGSALRASPFQNLNLTFDARYTFYQNDEQGAKVDRLFLDRIDWGDWKSVFGSRWMRLNSMRLDMDFRLQGKAGGATQGPNAASGPEPSELSQANLSGDRFDLEETMTDFNIPWNLTGSLAYSEDRNNPLKKVKSVWMRTGLDFNLTKNWKVMYNAQFDLLKKKAVSQDFSLHRDLHCWEAQVLWSPTGYKRFYLRINIKSTMLKELKFERGTGGRGLYGY